MREFIPVPYVIKNSTSTKIFTLLVLMSERQWRLFQANRALFEQFYVPHIEKMMDVILHIYSFNKGNNVGEFFVLRKESNQREFLLLLNTFAAVTRTFEIPLHLLDVAPILRSFVKKA